MSATEAETLSDVDEALAHMSASLHTAQVTGDWVEAERIAAFIDKTLDRRNELAQPCA